MQKRGLILALIAALVLAGCGGDSEERVLPTMAPRPDKEQSKTKEEGIGGLFSGIMSYVDESRQAMDETTAATLRAVVEIACVEARLERMEFPKEPIRFRYTADWGALDDSYSLLKEKILEIQGDGGALELQVEGNYMMVEISTDEYGNPKVKVELLNE